MLRKASAPPSTERIVPRFCCCVDDNTTSTSPEKTVGGRVIVVERDNGVVEIPAKMVDYTHHAKRHAADPETRENMKNVLAERVWSQHATL